MPCEAHYCVWCLAVLLLQVVNYNHIMPTRYTLDVDLKGVVSGEVIDDSSKKTDANKVRRKSVQSGCGYRLDQGVGCHVKPAGVGDGCNSLGVGGGGGKML